MPGVTIPGWGHIDFAGEYKPGDPRPSGYMDFFDWAEVQMAAGLESSKCGYCGKWYFPQELSETIHKTPAFTSKGVAIVVESRICLECEAKAATRKGADPA